MSSPLRRRGLPAAAATPVGLALAAALAGCGSPSAAGDDGRLDVVASPPAFLEVVERVGGDAVDATGATPPGADAHAAELTGEQVGGVVDADLAVYAAGLAPSVDEAVALRDGPSLDLMGVEGASPEDPHVWLDPALMADMAERVAAQLAEVDPAGADAYGQRADAYVEELRALDADLAEQLAPCRGAVLVTAHEAFGYLADRYGLEQTGITGIDPDVEPTPARLRDVATTVREAGVETVFFDDVTSTGVAQVLADEAGVTTAVLSPLETSVEPDYASAMRENAQVLRDGLVCGA
ncbi:metal ABC transporter substrate-binding protein [Pseudokineococcus sp. 5B2Z-1]|uniref:metal ABC transporter substrate-binding protein n=1 Tax=Pseudokineococcus sp. 5B2Z-1 TaxID=3132744 RepID=UPI003098E164